jgi:hypothetical protein
VVQQVGSVARSSGAAGVGVHAPGGIDGTGALDGAGALPPASGMSPIKLVP